MRALVILMVCVATGYVAHAETPAGKSVVIVRRDAGTPVRGPAERFTGVAHVDSRFNGAAGSRITSAIVSFEAGARTTWHTHPHGQLLVVVSGCGWAQQSGGKLEVIRAGDMIWTPPGVKHWHGAAANSPLSHAAVIERVDMTDVTWMEQVSDDQYGGVCPT